MAYTISEKNLARQRLLANILNPNAASHLAGLNLKKSGRWLDVGSGLGATTELLVHLLDSNGECVGLEQDPRLIEVAESHDWKERRVSFPPGDAMALPFDDDTFDFVFSRYLLVHLSDPLLALREMIRVSKPGGVVFAQEPDLAFDCCYPPSPSYERMPELWKAVFADAEIGGKLVHLFRGAGADPLDVRSDIFIEAQGMDLRRMHTWTFEAIGQALVSAGHMDSAEFSSLLDDFRQVESDASRVLISNPVISAWARA